MRWEGTKGSDALSFRNFYFQVHEVILCLFELCDEKIFFMQKRDDVFLDFGIVAGPLSFFA